MFARSHSLEILPVSRDCWNKCVNTWPSSFASSFRTLGWSSSGPKAFEGFKPLCNLILNIDNIYFDQMLDRIYPTELQLNRTNSADTEAPFLDLNLCISNGTVSTKIYDKRDNFDFDIVNFPFLDGDVPRRTSYGVYISQLIRFARASSNLNDFNYRNKALTAKLLRQGYRYFKLRKAFSKLYRRHSALLEKYSVSLKTHYFCKKVYRNPNFTVT